MCFDSIYIHSRHSVIQDASNNPNILCEGCYSSAGARTPDKAESQNRSITSRQYRTAVTSSRILRSGGTLPFGWCPSSAGAWTSDACAPAAAAQAVASQAAAAAAGGGAGSPAARAQASEVQAPAEEGHQPKGKVPPDLSILLLVTAVLYWRDVMLRFWDSALSGVRAPAEE